MLFKNIIEVGNYIYHSQLWKDYWAIDFIQIIDGGAVRVRCAYDTENKAQLALKQIQENKHIMTPTYAINYIKGAKLLCQR
ncbi:MAG: hypothetical protein KBS86_02660 [Proteobacteria bacterium]|nr:hypothetical protein [Candidatus Enterousia scatequi]MCQ2581513.1 hypothetical protein [Alphaproteobacteria bacterium]